MLRLFIRRDYGSKYQENCLRDCRQGIFKELFLLLNPKTFLFRYIFFYYPNSIKTRLADIFVTIINLVSHIQSNTFYIFLKNAQHISP